MSEIPAEGLLASQIQYKGVDFRIARLTPLFGHEVAEYLRPELLSKPLAGGGYGLSSLLGAPAILAMIKEGSGDVFPAEFIPAVAGLVDAVLTLSPAVMGRLRVDLFSKVSYRTKDMSDYEVLLGNEDDCFAGLPHFGIYVLIVRAFLVNFSDSFADVLSLIPGDKSQGKQTTSQ